MTLDHSTVVAIYGTHANAEAAIKELQVSGFDMMKFSIVARDFHTDEHVIGHYNAGDRMKYWGGIWGRLSGSASVFVPGIGPLLVAGPLVGRIIRALEGVAVVGGVSALGVSFWSMGIPENNIVQYETDVKSGKFVVIAHGTPDEAIMAREIIGRTNPDAVDEHQLLKANTEAELVGA